jgi:hypothetical protein
MALPESFNNGLVVEQRGNTINLGGGDYSYDTPWLETGEHSHIHITAAAGNGSDYKIGLEEGIFVSGYTDPQPSNWQVVASTFTQHLMPGAYSEYMASGEAFITARYFRIRVFGSASSTTTITARSL